MGGSLNFEENKKGGSVVTENPNGGSLKTLEGFRERPLKFAWKMKTWGGLQKSSKVVRGDYFSEVTFKGWIS